MLLKGLSEVGLVDHFCCSDLGSLTWGFMLIIFLVNLVDDKITII